MCALSTPSALSAPIKKIKNTDLTQLKIHYHLFIFLLGENWIIMD